MIRLRTPGRVTLRRSLAATGVYAAVALGFLATLVAARIFPKEVFALYTLVIAATAFFQSLLDLTVEEALVKYGFRYVTREDWGRLRRLFWSGGLLKLAGAALGGIGLLALAPFADGLFNTHGLRTPLLVAAALPLGQSLEGLAGSALFLRGRYDVRSGFLTVSMALRLTAVAVGASYGLTATIVAVVAAQYLATVAVGAGGWVAFHRFPRAAARPLGEERRGIASFILQSSAASGMTSLRGTLAPLLLGMVAPTVQVGYFRVAQAPQSGFVALSAPARMVLLTEQTRDWERGRQAHVLAGVRRYSAVAAALMVVALPPLLVFMPDLVRLVYGAKYLPAAAASRVFVLVAAVLFVVGWTKSFPVSIGRPNLRILTHGVETIVLLPLIVVLGAAYGATGAAVATLAGACAFALVWAGIFVRMRPEEEPPLLATEPGAKVVAG